VARGKNGGPRRVRGEGKLIYGLAKLTPEETKKVRIGTACALRALAAAAEFHKLDRPWMIETSQKYNGNPNLFELPEYEEFYAKHDTVDIFGFVQCAFDAKSTKPSRMLSSLDLHDMPNSCTHKQQWWFTPGKSWWTWAAHAPLIGKVRAVPAGTYGDRPLRAPPVAPSSFVGPGGTEKTRDSQYLTQEAACYTEKLNMFLMTTLADAARARFANAKDESSRTEPTEDKYKSKVLYMHAAPPIQATARLKGMQTEDIDEETSTVGGSRNTSEAMRKVQGHLTVGPQLGEVIRKLVDEVPHLKQLALQALARE